MSLVRVDFYLLNSPAEEDKRLFICRLLEKVYHRGHRIFVVCESQAHAEQMDELLWTFKDDSFIPHNLQGEGPQPPPPVQIGFGPDKPRDFHDILVNLSADIPSYFVGFKRIIEVVANDEPAKEVSRNRYRDYRAHRCDLHIHEIQG